MSFKKVAILNKWHYPSKYKSKDVKDTLFTSSTFSGLKFRYIGPAIKSGRIADIVIHPDNPNIWYVAVGSGGVWKTENAGTTWKPIFDSQPVYSIGSLTIDSNPSYDMGWYRIECRGAAILAGATVFSAVLMMERPGKTWG